MNQSFLNPRRWMLAIAALLILPATSALALDRLVFEGKDGPGKGKSIVFISGDEEYRSEESMPMLAKIMAKDYGFKCTVLFEIDPQTGDIDVNQHNNIPGLEALDTADLMVILTRFRAPADDQMKHVDDYVKAGKPIVGLRTATHAFSGLKGQYAKYNYNAKGEWDAGFGRHILGDTWVSHHGAHKKESTRGIIPDVVKDNPILRGVSDIWVSTDVYGITKLPDNSVVLVQGQVLKGMDPKDEPVEGKKNDPMMPIAWTRTYKSDDGSKDGRVFCTTMGASSDLVNPGLRRMVINACLWGTGLEDQIRPDSKIDIIGPYEPKMYGFIKEFPKGLKPESFIAGGEDLMPAGK